MRRPGVMWRRPCASSSMPSWSHRRGRSVPAAARAARGHRAQHVARLAAGAAARRVAARCSPPGAASRPAEVAAHFARAGDRPGRPPGRWPPPGTPRDCSRGGEASASWRRVWELWRPLSEDERPACRARRRGGGLRERRQPRGPHERHVRLLPGPGPGGAGRRAGQRRRLRDRPAAPRVREPVGADRQGRRHGRDGAGSGAVRACRPTIRRARPRHRSTRDQPVPGWHRRPERRTTSWPGRPRSRSSAAIWTRRSI